MAIDVTPTTKKPTHDIRLSKGSDEVGLILCNQAGTHDPRAKVVNSYPRTSTKMDTGSGGKYSKLNLPYTKVVQDDWTGGRGSKWFEDDKSRYLDGHNVITWFGNQVTLGGERNGNALGAANTRDGLFFMYKGALYFVTTPRTGGSQLFRCGYRGVLTSAPTGPDYYLIDTNQVWTPDALIGGMVKIVGGAGVQDPETILEVVDNTATELDVTYDTALTYLGTTTEYVVTNLGTTMVEVSGVFSTAPCRDVVVANEMVYFLMEGAVIRRYREYNDGGTWTEEVLTEEYEAELGVAITGGDGKTILWLVDNEDDFYGHCVKKATVPEVWGTYGYLYQDLGELRAAGIMFDWLDGDVSQSGLDNVVNLLIGSSFTTGVVARYILDEPVTIERSTYLAAAFKSTVTCNTGDLRIHLYGHTMEGPELVDGLMVLHKNIMPAAAYYYDGTDWWPADNLLEDDDAKVFEFPAWATTHKFYLAFTERVDELLVRMGGTVNAVTSALSLELWTGSRWQSVSIDTDGTASGGATLAQHGTIEWTRPDDWDKGTDISLSTGEENLAQGYYYLRLTVSVNLTADTTIANIIGADDRAAASTLRRWQEPMDLAYNGWAGSTVRVSLQDNGSIVINHGEKYNTITFDLAVMNAIAATLTASYFNGEELTALTIVDGTASGGATLAQDGSITFTIPDDWQPNTTNGQTGYKIWLSPSAVLTRNVEIAEVSVDNTEKTVFHVPGLTADEFEWGRCSTSTIAQEPAYEKLEVKMIEVYRNSNLGLQTFSIEGPLALAGAGYGAVEIGDGSAWINGIQAYGDQRKNPWALTEKGPVEIQTENGDTTAEIPLEELDVMLSRMNGRASCANDVHMYFNMGPRVMQYFNGNLTDVGPTRDEGLPSDRQGDVVALLSVPGAVLAGVNAGSSGYSSVLLLKEGSVHEFFRGLQGEELCSLAYEEIQGLGYGWVWISTDEKIYKVPYSVSNPLNVSGFPFTDEGGSYVTGWIHADYLNVEKFLKALQNYTENLSAAHQEIDVSYQLETGALGSGWTTLGNTYDTSPFQEELFSATYNVKGRRLRLQFDFSTDDTSVTPVLYSWLLECLMRFKVKWMWTLTFRLRDRDKDLLGALETDASNGQVLGKDKWDLLLTWLGDPLPIVMNSLSTLEDGEYVFIEPGSLRVKNILIDEVVENDAGDKLAKETRICQVNLLQI